MTNNRVYYFTLIILNNNKDVVYITLDKNENVSVNQSENFPAKEQDFRVNKQSSYDFFIANL